MSSTQNSSPKKEIFDNLVKLLNSKKFDELEKKLNELIEQHPKSYPLYNLKGVYKKIVRDFNDSELAFKEAIKINNKIPDAYNNLGLLNVDQKKIDNAIDCFNKAINLNSNNPFYFNNLGNAFAQKDLYNESLQEFQKALSLDQNFFISHNNVGLIKFRQKRFDEAIQSYEKAIKIQPNFDDPYINLGITYFEIGEINLSIKNYETALKKNPNSAKAYNNLGIVLKDQGFYNEAIKNYEASIKINPNFFETYNNLGIALNEINKFDDAISAYEKSIELNPNYSESFNNLANIYSKKNNLLKAINYYEKSYNINSNNTALASLIYSKMKLSDWSAFDDFKKVENKLGINSETIMPFYTLVMEDNPKNQLLRSKNYSKQKLQKFYRKDEEIKVYKNKKIKVCYFSADFFDHATMYLISGLFREHNKDKFEILLFDYGNNKKTPFVEGIIKTVDLYKNISEMNDNEIVNLSRNSEIDIAVDLKGYTLNSKSKLFAYRLAPIQINFLGYPGTLGSPFIDYLVSDQNIIPDHLRSNYSENIIFMPDTYQPNDNKRIISKNESSRSDFNLPSNAFIFCCFNSIYKITPLEFNIWSRLLSKVKNSVLWLLDTNEFAKENLIKNFMKKNIDSNRIIFAKNIPQEEHLERIRHADLFLDTFNYNAHTTCSDVLWSGVPIVTKVGEQFAARVASSLLSALDLKELITSSQEDYEKLILELAINKDKLSKIRKKIANNLLKTALFDTTKYTKAFESGLVIAYENNLKQKDACDIKVT